MHIYLFIYLLFYFILWYTIDAIGGIFKFTIFPHKDFIKLIIPPTLHYMLTKSMLKNLSWL